jgi:hypothetical protein
MIADSQDSMNDPLVTYLEDHKAGAGLSIGLLQAMEARRDDETLSRFARSLLSDIEEDEETLRNGMGWGEGKPRQARGRIVRRLWNLRGARIPLDRNPREAQPLAGLASRGRFGRPSAQPRL